MAGITIQIQADASGVQQGLKPVSNLMVALSGIQKQLDAMAKATGTASNQMIQGLGSIETATKATARATQVMAQDMTRSLKQVETSAKTTATQGFDLMGVSLKKLAATATALVGGISLAALAKSALDTASTFENLDIRLRFLTDSVEAFNQAKQFILDFARTTPLQLDEVSNAFVRLTASGFDAAKMIPTLVDAVSFFGGSNEQLQALVVNFQQMATQATVSGQELRDISRSTMIPAFQLVAEEARKMGIEIGDSAAEAGISGMKAIEFFMKAAQERFKGATLIMSTTWNVLVSNLIDQWKIFSDTVIRESGFLNFMKAAALELFELMNRLITDNKTEFVSWGDTVIASMRKASLSIAALLDLLNGVLSLGARVQAQFAEWERQGGEVMANLYNSVAQFFGFTGTFTAKVQADVAQATGAIAAGIMSNDITAAVDQTFDRLQQRAEELRKTQEGIRGQKPVFATPPAGIDKAAAAREAKEAVQSAVERAKAVEDVLKSSLQRQETMIEASADTQRRAIDEAARAAIVTQGPGVVEAEASKRAQALQKIATETAAKLETLRLETLDKQMAAREVTLKAEIAAAGKNLSAATAAQEELTNLTKVHEEQRAIITGKRLDADQKTSEQQAKAAIAHARDLNKILSEIEDDRIAGRIDLVDEQISLIEAQMQGEVLATQEGTAQIQALESKRFEDVRLQATRAAQVQIDEINRVVQATLIGTDARTQAETLAVEKVAQINQGLATTLQGIDIQQQTQQQTHLNELSKGWREWVKDVESGLGDFLVDVFEGQIKSIQSLFDRLKNYFFRVIAEMVAYAATHQIVVPIVSTVLGGLGLAGAAGVPGAGDAGGTGGLLKTGMSILGLGNQLNSVFGQSSPVSGALGALTNKLWGAVNGLDALIEGEAAWTAAMESATLSDVTGGALGGTQAASALSPTLGIVGGAAALGMGIFKALNAATIAEKAAWSASAAAGAAALASTALVAAGVIAASSGWTGIGLIAAAVTAVIGTVLPMLTKPAGPALAVGGVSGLNIGTAGGQLQVQGDLGSRVLRRDKVDPGVAAGVQAQLEEGITAAVVSIVQTINAVALDPAALVGPTQDALQKALNNIQPINSANAKKMENDLKEQLRFANIAIVGGLLEPLNLAFNQIRDNADLKQQLERLPATTQGLVEIFKGMNTQLDEIAKSENTDVLRQLSAVRNQVENFGNRIAGTAGQIAEQIVTGIVEQFQQQVDTTLAGQITQFAGLMNASLGALAGLRQTQQTLAGAGLTGGGLGSQIDRLVTAIQGTSARISTEIVSTALQGLSADLKTILVEPLRVQATTVNSLFNDALAALHALGTQWQNLSSAGIDTTAIQAQFGRLVGGILDTVSTVLTEAFAGGDMAEFLTILGSIPEAVTNLNPVWARLRQIGAGFAQVVGPIAQTITTLQDELRSTEERVAFTAEQVAEWRTALVQAGSAIDKALPLYAQLAQAIQASAQAQIEAVNKTAEARIQAIQDEYDRVLKIVQVWADGETKAINDFTDAATKAYDALFDGLRDSTNRYFDAATKAYDDFFDSYIAAVNAAYDQERDAWDRWAEDMLAGLTAFVDASTQMINDWADSANTTAGQLETVNRTLLGEMSPAAQRTELEERKAIFEAQVRGGGPGADRALTELISINQDLLALAKQSDDLGQQKKALDELRVLQKILQDRLYAATGETDPVLAQIKVALVQEAALKEIAAYQKAQSEYITKTQQAAIEALEQRRRDHLDTLEIIRTRVQEGFEAARAAKLEEIEVIRVRVQEAFEAHRTAKLEEIEATRTILEERLAADRDKKLEEVTDWQEKTVKAIKVDMVYQLQLVQYELQKMFAMQYKALTGMDLAPPTPPTAPPPAAQQGGLLAFASMNRAMTGPLALAMGGRVQAMLEPGERVFTPPMSHAQQGALLAMNTAFPRQGGGFMVPGSGSGDSVPALVPSGSFVLNRRASHTLGYQGGGPVSSHRSRPVEQRPIIVNVYQQPGQNVRELISEISRQLRREFRSSNSDDPWR